MSGPGDAAAGEMRAAERAEVGRLRTELASERVHSNAQGAEIVRLKAVSDEARAESARLRAALTAIKERINRRIPSLAKIDINDLCDAALTTPAPASYAAPRRKA